MAFSVARSASTSLTTRSAQRTTARSSVSKVTGPRAPVQRTAAPSQSPASRVSTRASPVEIAQIAGEAGFITGTALTMVAITLVGLAVGFVLLRVEALVEEGKL